MAFTNAEDLFARIGELFRADKAQDDKALLAFNLSGKNFWMKVDKGTLESGSGDAPGEPDLILKAAAEDFVKIMNREMNPMTAFMSGKVKAERNMGLAIKLMGWFGLS
ncbi:MAG: SCP2 sterol-binding domain-containing protein [Anaerolinea sp.]|nr:SCP2 sterol-binding domain-containing protein [Anaerolinea sp.]MCC6974014.1 SCP2 sterol-binding domain-containing protein [Anaerolineae bacterium]